jgi:hypothetical protein
MIRPRGQAPLHFQDSLSCNKPDLGLGPIILDGNLLGRSATDLSVWIVVLDDERETTVVASIGKICMRLCENIECARQTCGDL